jgi:hypothetical protein
MLLRSFRLLLPVLFPSWRFFMTVGPSPRIEYRAVPGDATWQENDPVPERLPPQAYVRNLFWNRRRNTQLYTVALAERLIAAPSDHSVQELSRLIANRHTELSGAFQFRLVFVVPHEGKLIRETLYESAPVQAEEVRR